MSYLVCQKCGGYYTLKEGEKPGEFERCECGGTLRYVQNFNSHFDEELDPINELNICPDCGTENSERYCKSCGKMVKDTKNEENSSSKDKNTLNKFKIYDAMILRLIAIIIGILIVLIPSFLFTNQDYSLLLLLVGGVVTSLIAGGKSEDGALNGVIMGLIASLLLLILKGNFIFTSDIVFNTKVIIFEMSGAVLILALFGLIGGIVGIFLRDILIKTETS